MAAHRRAIKGEPLTRPWIVRAFCGHQSASCARCRRRWGVLQGDRATIARRAVAADFASQLKRRRLPPGFVVAGALLGQHPCRDGAREADRVLIGRVLPDCSFASPVRVCVCTSRRGRRRQRPAASGTDTQIGKPCKSSGLCRRSCSSYVMLRPILRKAIGVQILFGTGM